MKYKRHIATSMERSKVQPCLSCGKIMTDLRNAAWPSDCSAPTGFPTGNVFTAEIGAGHEESTIFMPNVPHEVVDCMTGEKV